MMMFLYYHFGHTDEIIQAIINEYEESVKAFAIIKDPRLKE
jgi:hypothetical protein